MRNWDDVERAAVGDVVAWASTQPWAAAMAVCGQDAGWHAEGDVWTHTRLVVEELERLDEWRGLDARSRLILLFTALFHDSGKPATTTVDPESGRTRSPKHASVGVAIARTALRQLDCPLAVREEICGLVRHHGRPPYLLDKTDPVREIISISWVANHRLLYLFALADARGRRSVEVGRPEEALQLWKTTAEEHGCFEGPYRFANDQARFLYFRDELSNLHYTPREDYRCTVTLLSGLPGAGKDSWLRQQRPTLPVVALDDVREDCDVDPTDDQGQVIQIAREMCRDHLRAGRDFAFNATNTMRATRKRWLELFAGYGARIEWV
jgi:putative nucleotidyltransferase with HDIG domain